MNLVDILECVIKSKNLPVLIKIMRKKKNKNNFGINATPIFIEINFVFLNAFIFTNFKLIGKISY